MKKITLAGNWKLHKSPNEAQEFLQEFLPWWQDQGGPHEAWLFPPAICLPAFSAAPLPGTFKFGPQNFWVKTQGAYTGENSLEVARGLGSRVALVGHSERRQLFGESDSLVQEKVQLARSLGVLPVLCLGETLEERNKGRSLEVARAQMEAVLQDESPFKLAVAYEPVWAIGTGKVASPDQAGEVHQALKDRLGQLWGEQGLSVPLLYGGSVKPENAKELFSQPPIDGFLVGGASLDPLVFRQIFESVQKP